MAAEDKNVAQTGTKWHQSVPIVVPVSNNYLVTDRVSFGFLFFEHYLWSLKNMGTSNIGGFNSGCKELLLFFKQIWLLLLSSCLLNSTLSFIL